MNETVCMGCGHTLEEDDAACGFCHKLRGYEKLPAGSPASGGPTNDTPMQTRLAALIRELDPMHCLSPEALATGLIAFCPALRSPGAEPPTNQERHLGFLAGIHAAAEVVIREPGQLEAAILIEKILGLVAESPPAASVLACMDDARWTAPPDENLTDALGCHTLAELAEACQRIVDHGEEGTADLWGSSLMATAAGVFRYLLRLPPVGESPPEENDGFELRHGPRCPASRHVSPDCTCGLASFLRSLGESQEREETWVAVERSWCEALLPEGPDVIQRVTARVLALRPSVPPAGPAKQER